MIALSIVSAVLIVNGVFIIPAKDLDIKLLEQQINDDRKLIKMMDNATKEYENNTYSILDAVRQAELDNFTMQNQISQHCFFKMTGQNQSLERCYGSNIVDERIQA